MSTHPKVSTVASAGGMGWPPSQQHSLTLEWAAGDESEALNVVLPGGEVVLIERLSAADAEERMSVVLSRSGPPHKGDLDAVGATRNLQSAAAKWARHRRGS